MTFEVIHGDCRSVVDLMADNCIDAIVTDPPYGLKFMGKEWDHGVPGVDFWERFLRVLKPGGHLVAPENGLVLDPFCGSGSTGCAAVLENMRFVGVEKDEGFVAIARERIDHWTPKQRTLL